MSKFALKKLTMIKGKQDFFDLQINGIGQFDYFDKNVEAQYKSEVVTLITRMEWVANSNPLPKTKFRNITPKKQIVKEYEFKTKHLRLYVIHIVNTGKVIVVCGCKNTQKSDIVKFRSLKKQFLES